MVLDLVMVTGEALSIVALLYGAYLALTATEMFQQLFARLKRAGGAHRAGWTRELPAASSDVF